MEIGFYGLRKFGRFIKRLFRWLPVLWRQEEWDSGYIYDILDVKLKELRNKNHINLRQLIMTL